MLIVAKQDRVNPTQLFRGKRRPRGFLESHRARLVDARRVKRRIGQQPEPAEFDKNRRTTDESEGELIARHARKHKSGIAPREFAVCAQWRIENAQYGVHTTDKYMESAEAKVGPFSQPEIRPLQEPFASGA